MKKNIEKDFEKQYKIVLKNIYKFITSRLLIVFICTVFLFYIMIARLFNLQIIHGEEIQDSLIATTMKEISLPAPRGNIYDRNGRPLAVNKVAYTVKVIDNGVKMSVEARNEMLLDLIHILEDNDHIILDDMPISKTMPYTFLFNNSEERELAWKTDLGIPKNQLAMNAEETYQYLVELFKVSNDLNEIDKRKLIGLRYAIYQKRFRKYEPVIVSVDVSQKTIAKIEEQNQKFPGVYIEADSFRYYPEADNFSHILGYIRRISESDFSKYKEFGYTRDKIIGQLGIERSMELELNGTDGSQNVEVDILGRRISEEEAVYPTPGNNVFLTIDATFQKKVAQILEQSIADVLLDKFDPQNAKDIPVSLKQLFISMVNSNNISLEKIWASELGSTEYVLKNIIEDEFDEYNRIKLREEIENYRSSSEEFERMTEAKQILCSAIDNSKLSLNQMILVLYEQKIIDLDEQTLELVESNRISPLSVIKQKLQNGELTPAQTNLDPCTGAVSVVDVKTGDALALVTYPSYDNNQLVNNFNNAYYNQLLKDPTTPMINRPLMQRKAPGSTFKMVTAITGLQEGVISPFSYISDAGRFTKAGSPAAHCWIFRNGNGTHGSINVARALEVSCNYFFYETSYRLGSSSAGNRLDSINKLNDYMRRFGLDSYTGVEIEESKPEIASPEYKEVLIKRFQNPDATPSQTNWSDGDTIRTAIGQSYNNFAAAHMAKYVATLANGGTRYKMNLIDKIESYDNKIVEQFVPFAEDSIQIEPENLDIVKKGMLDVTVGSLGTVRRIFTDSKIQIAGKTGTAQESSVRPSHTWFVCFAPYDEPEIAIAVLIPFGESSLTPAAVVSKKIVEEYMGLNYEPEIISMDNILRE